MIIAVYRESLFGIILPHGPWRYRRINQRNNNSSISEEQSDKTIEQIVVYDVNGHLLGSFPDEENLLKNTFSMGVYIVQIQYSDGTFETKKLIK